MKRNKIAGTVLLIASLTALGFGFYGYYGCLLVGLMLWAASEKVYNME